VAPIPKVERLGGCRLKPKSIGLESEHLEAIGLFYMNDSLRRGRSVVFSLNYHLVFVTKYRRRPITNRVREFLKGVFAEVCEDFGGALEEMDGEADHIHLLVSMPPKVAPAKLVNSLKGVSSRHLRSQRLPEVRRALWGEHFWSPSYFVSSTGGATLAKVKAYIQHQRQPQTGASSRP
jgi:putative transposase